MKWFDKNDPVSTGQQEQSQGNFLNRSLQVYDNASNRPPMPPPQYGGQFGGIFDWFLAIWQGFLQRWTAFRYQFHRRTFGVFDFQKSLAPTHEPPKMATEKKEKNLPFIAKICIIGIIMFTIFQKDLVAWRKGTNFAVREVKNSTVAARTASQTNPSAQPVRFGAHSSNPFAPASPEELHEAQVRSYIDQYSQIAKREMANSGIPASISMAQGIIESRAGKSILAQKNNNQFGIKCFSKACPKGHCTNFTDDHHKDFFRKYANPTESWQEHTQFLQRDRYRPLFRMGRNYRMWAQGLRDLGYATDPQYDQKLISVIERYQLQRLDN
ncbi:MAG: hypothetical protein RL757_846 [Bacteroidota bacterium]|jgi:flagellum-specific peptidoglycan hydrolase FlgJ